MHFTQGMQMPPVVAFFLCQLSASGHLAVIVLNSVGQLRMTSAEQGLFVHLQKVRQTGPVLPEVSGHMGEGEEKGRKFNQLELFKKSISISKLSVISKINGHMKWNRTKLYEPQTCFRKDAGTAEYRAKMIRER